MNITLTQALGAAAMAVSLTAYLFKSDRHMKAALMVAMALWAPYYWLLGGQSGCAFAILIGVRQVISLNTHRMSLRVSNLFLGVLVVAMTVFVGLTWQGLQSLLPWLATMNSTLCYLKYQGVRMRLQIMCGDWLWVAYDIFVGAWIHLAFMLAAIALNSLTTYRLYRKQQEALGSAVV